MKAVILAAGKGVRMLPLTVDKPKVMVNVLGKPFLEYVLDNLHQAGIREIEIIVGYKKEIIADFLKKKKITATLIEQKEQLGTGHAVLQAEKFCGRDQFIIVSGDNLFAKEDLKAVQQNDSFSYLMGKEVSHPEKYGVLVVEKDKLIRIVEKPQQFIGKWINIGLYKFTSEIWRALHSLSLSQRGEYELTDAINILAKQGKVKVLPLQHYWLDLGCKEDIKKIEKFLENKS